MTTLNGTYIDKNKKTIAVTFYSSTNSFEAEHVHPNQTRNTFYYYDTEEEMIKHLRKYKAVIA